MVRTQIQLTEAQAEALARVARERGVSKAALVREAVEHVVASDERARKWQRALAAVGKFSSGKDENVSEDHDRYLEEAYLDWRSS